MHHQVHSITILQTAGTHKWIEFISGNFMSAVRNSKWQDIAFFGSTISEINENPKNCSTVAYAEKHRICEILSENLFDENFMCTRSICCVYCIDFG